MSATEKQVFTCPACGVKSLVSHCGDAHPTCDWKMCRNKDCEALLDLARKLGHAKEPGRTDVRRRVDLTGGAS